MADTWGKRTRIQRGRWLRINETIHDLKNLSDYLGIPKFKFGELEDKDKIVLRVD